MTALPMTRSIRLGARTSSLARAQANQVASALAADGVEVTFVGITTTGDLDQRQLTEIGGTGVFVSALRDALRRGEIDVAVHSLKDLPTTPAEDLEITISETPRHNWGIRGLPADELGLTYEVNV